MFRKRKGTTKITIETHEVMRVKLRSGKTNPSYCGDCGRTVSGVPPDRVAQLIGTDDVVVNGGGFPEVHRTNDGAYCGESLAAYFKGREPQDVG